MVNHAFVTDPSNGQVGARAGGGASSVDGISQIASGSTHNGCPRQVAFKKPAARVEVARQ